MSCANKHKQWARLRMEQQSSYCFVLCSEHKISTIPSYDQTNCPISVRGLGEVERCILQHVLSSASWVWSDLQAQTVPISRHLTAHSKMTVRITLSLLSFPKGSESQLKLPVIFFVLCSQDSLSFCGLEAADTRMLECKSAFLLPSASVLLFVVSNGSSVRNTTVATLCRKEEGEWCLARQ